MHGGQGIYFQTHTKIRQIKGKTILDYFQSHNFSPIFIFSPLYKLFSDIYFFCCHLSLFVSQTHFSQYSKEFWILWVTHQVQNGDVTERKVELEGKHWSTTVTVPADGGWGGLSQFRPINLIFQNLFLPSFPCFCPALTNCAVTITVNTLGHARPQLNGPKNLWTSLEGIEFQLKGRTHTESYLIS